ncbi:MAG: lysophospholipase [Chloroflexota bacterium]
MSTSEYQLASPTGAALFGRAWLPAATPRAVVCLVHGFGEHSGRYQTVADFLAQREIAVLAYDQRGHGRSPGARGAVASYSRLLDDVGALLEEARRRFGGLPRFLYGHSMGGGEVLRYAIERQPSVTGVVATSPWLELPNELPPWQIALAATLCAIAPGVALPRQDLDSHKLSHQEPATRAYDADPLVHHRVTARLFWGCRASGRWTLAHAGQLRLPVLLLHGSADVVTSPAASRRFAQRAGAWCRYREWEGLLHELHQEAQAPEVLACIAGWLAERTAAVSTIAHPQEPA